MQSQCLDTAGSVDGLMPDRHPNDSATVGIVGAGAWGTALALVAHRAGHKVILVTHTDQQAAAIRGSGYNQAYLPDVPLPREWRVTSHMSVLEHAHCVVMATPAQTARHVADAIAPYVASSNLPVVVTCKGIVPAVVPPHSGECSDDAGESLGSPTFVVNLLQDVLPGSPLVVLSGPSFAVDVALDLPTAVVVASASAQAADYVQRLLCLPRFRIYTSDDVVGVQLGGAYKNVVAIAAGIAWGLALGDNARAALITRGLAELTRLASALGAEPAVITGLAGLGDMVLTCSSPKSRNMSLGILVAKEGSAVGAIRRATYLSEGRYTAGMLVKLACQYDVDVPICQNVHDVLRGVISPAQAVENLVQRPVRRAPLGRRMHESGPETTLEKEWETGRGKIPEAPGVASVGERDKDSV